MNPATSNHNTDPANPASAEVSAPKALTSQHPAIQPIVPMARTGPNSFLASFSRLKTMVLAMLHEGAVQKACS